MQKIEIRRVDYTEKCDVQALNELLNHYALDLMGGSEAIPVEALARLCPDLAQRPNAFSFIAWEVSEEKSDPIVLIPVGLVNCFEAYSTFKAKPLVNIHDIVIHQDWRGKGIGQQLLKAVELEANRRGACKLTLEVLSNNHSAINSYSCFGFAPYTLDPAAGTAGLMQKWIA